MFGERLQTMRKRKGLSLRALSDRIGNAVSAQALSNYERDEFCPSSDILAKIADALDTTIDRLMARQDIEIAPADIRLRKGAPLPSREKVQAVAAITDFLQGWHEIEQILDLCPRPFKKPKAIKMAEVESFATKLRRDWKLGSGPIASMADLLEHQGIKVCALKLPENLFGLHCTAKIKGCGKKISAIIINRRHNRECRRITMAHELFHHLAHCHKNDEKAARLFAGAFLMPGKHLQAQIGKRRKRIIADEILLLKRIYGVSAIEVLLRLNALGSLDDHALAYARRTYARQWQSREPLPMPDQPEHNPELPSRFRKLCVQALAEGLISIRKGALLLDISVPEAASIANGRRP
ncbi:MAG: XRE family transcriptional regulator [Betaproteobacteria bacterium]|nr:XRE family transcriptional regulator [Betaproteobacteria bacterium]